MVEEKEDNTMHWADKYAEEIIKRNPDKKNYVIETGITPSGGVHVGNFRETMTQDLIYKALLSKGKKATYQFYWDDYDRFRKVPAGVPKEWEQYLEMPVCKVPDPEGCHASYAEHCEAPLIEDNKRVGVDCVYLKASEEYPKGIYAEYIKTAIENKDKIREILNRYKTDENTDESWLPIEVYCEKCWTDKTKYKYVGGYNVEYTCACGNSGTLDFKGKGAEYVKIRWRAEWPMRWAFYGVDFESAGKDHHASGGSWDTGVPICKDVYKSEAPIGPMYEFIYLKGQKEKMSKSVGNIVRVRDLLEVYDRELVRYLYTPKLSKAFEIAFDQDLVNAYNYFDEARKMYYGKSEKEPDKNEIRKYELSKMSDKYVELPQFSVCVNVMEIAVGNVQKAKEILKKTGHPYEHADERLTMAWSWVNDYAPEQYKFVVQEKMPAVAVSPAVKEVLSMAADQIGKISGDELQDFIFNTSKEKGVPMQEVFKTAYMLLLNKERGPKLGGFLASLDADFAAKRLKMVA